jgi:hypothetical protein
MWKTGGVVSIGEGQESNPYTHCSNPFLKFLKYIQPPVPPIDSINGGVGEDR